MTGENHELQHAWSIRPAYDCIGVQPCVHGNPECVPGSGQSHGRHNAELQMSVRSADVEVSVVIGTGWDLPTVPRYQRVARDRDYPRGQFVEFHTAYPRVEGQERRDPHPQGTCKDWPGCYIDQGYLMADTPARLLLEKGSDAVWEWLEAEHASVSANVQRLREGRADA